MQQSGMDGLQQSLALHLQPEYAAEQLGRIPLTKACVNWIRTNTKANRCLPILSIDFQLDSHSVPTSPFLYTNNHVWLELAIHDKHGHKTVQKFRDVCPKTLAFLPNLLLSCDPGEAMALRSRLRVRLPVQLAVVRPSWGGLGRTLSFTCAAIRDLVYEPTEFRVRTNKAKSGFQRAPRQYGGKSAWMQ